MRADHRRLPNAGKEWQAVCVPLPACVPACLHPWIGLEASMMTTLRRALGAEPSLRLLSDARGDLFDEEAALLTPHRRHGQVREVVISGAGEPLVAARTVYTAPDLLRLPALVSLGGRPLGELLFAAGQSEWLRRDYAEIEAGMPAHALVRRACGATVGPCWGRRTVFLLARQSLLVTEIFLPALQTAAKTVFS